MSNKRPLSSTEQYYLQGTGFVVAYFVILFNLEDKAISHPIIDGVREYATIPFIIVACILLVVCAYKYFSDVPFKKFYLVLALVHFGLLVALFLRSI